MRAVITFLRANPVTNDHGKLVQKVNVTARSLNATPRIYLSHTYNEDTDPLPYTEKYKHVREAFGNMVTSSEAATIIDVMKILESQGFKEVTYVAPADQVQHYRDLLEKYNGQEYSFFDVHVISGGVNNPEEISATMRESARAGNYQEFSDLAPSELTEEAVKSIYNSIREKLGGEDNMAISDLNKDRSWLLADGDPELNERFEQSLEEEPESELTEDKKEEILDQKEAELNAMIDAEEELYEEDEQPSQDNAMAEFATALLHARTISHLMHLKTRNYAAHIALKEFYEALPPMVDTVLESFQGKYGLITDYPHNYGGMSKEPEEFLRSLNEYIQDIRKELPQDSEIQNEIDAIVTLVNSTLYKLRFLG